MQLSEKKSILLNYFNGNGGVPKGALSIDCNTDTIGNVSVNGSWYGTFDYIRKEFISLAD